MILLDSWVARLRADPTRRVQGLKVNGWMGGRPTFLAGGTSQFGSTPSLGRQLMVVCASPSVGAAADRVVQCGDFLSINFGTCGRRRRRLERPKDPIQ